MIFIFSTVFCQFSTIQQSDPVTHIYVCVHIHSFSHIILHHASSQVTRYSSQCYTAGSHCLSKKHGILHRFACHPHAGAIVLILVYVLPKRAPDGFLKKKLKKLMSVVLQYCVSFSRVIPIYMNFIYSLYMNCKT